MQKHYDAILAEFSEGIEEAFHDAFKSLADFDFSPMAIQSVMDLPDAWVLDDSLSYECWTLPDWCPQTTGFHVHPDGSIATLIVSLPLHGEQCLQCFMLTHSQHLSSY